MLSAIKPDCILMDIMMPGMDGVETTRRIKSLKAFEEIPVLMITARDEVSGIQDALDAGAVDYWSSRWNNSPSCQGSFRTQNATRLSAGQRS